VLDRIRVNLEMKNSTATKLYLEALEQNRTSQKFRDSIWVCNIIALSAAAVAAISDERFEGRGRASDNTAIRLHAGQTDGTGAGQLATL
jgi:hypothetical protein